MQERDYIAVTEVKFIEIPLPRLFANVTTLCV